MERKGISPSLSKAIAGRQLFKCANQPGSQLRGLDNYKCISWSSATHQGSFDESGWEIDHKIEWHLTQDDDENNLQALCKSCHVTKTKRYLRLLASQRRENKKRKTLAESEEEEEQPEEEDQEQESEEEQVSPSPAKRQKLTIQTIPEYKSDPNETVATYERLFHFYDFWNHKARDNLKKRYKLRNVPGGTYYSPTQSLANYAIAEKMTFSRAIYEFELYVGRQAGLQAQFEDDEMQPCNSCRRHLHPVGYLCCGICQEQISYDQSLKQTIVS